MRTDWHVATILHGTGITCLGTGDRVVFRLCDGEVQVIGRGKITARLSLAAAQHSLETQRTPDLRPVRAANQIRLSIRWDTTREARRFDGRDGKRAA